MAVVRLRAPLSELAGGRKGLKLEGATVADVVRTLEREHPDVAGWILDERGRIREHINIEPHPTNPYEEVGVKLGYYQFEHAQAWEERGQLALVGIGIEPGAADVFARHAADELFSEIDEVGIRDGANLTVEGYDFAPTFSIDDDRGVPEPGWSERPAREHW